MIMSTINVKILNDECIDFAKKNAKTIVEKINAEPNNTWIHTYFPDNPFIEKTHTFNDFSLKKNVDSKNRDIDFENGKLLYENLSKLPRVILTSEGFWLWLLLDKFYNVTRDMVSLTSETTFLNHWTFKQGKRRGLMFGVLSRLYFRVELSVDEIYEDKYFLTKWLYEKPERYRNLSWSTYSSQKHIVRGALKGEIKAMNEIGECSPKIFPAVAKQISLLGSVKLLDVMSEQYFEDEIYKFMLSWNDNNC